MTNTPKPQAKRIYEILNTYRWNTQSIDEDLVLQQYPEKVVQAHTDSLDEAKQGIEALITEKMVELTSLLNDPVNVVVKDHYQYGYQLKENK